MAGSLSFDDFLKRSNEFHGNKYDYSKVNYTNTITNVEIICQNHGSFWQAPVRHFKSIGCKKCVAQNKLNNVLPSILKKYNNVPGDLYDYSKVKYLGSSNDIEVICKTHGSFWINPTYHYKYGCSKCLKDSLLNSRNSKFILDAKIIHGNLYDYSQSYLNPNNYNINIMCRKHGLFSLRIYDHLKGRGCNRCSYLTPNWKKYNTTEFINSARLAHGNKYDYSKSKYSGSKVDLIIICKIHGEFLQKPEVHVNMGCGCPSCGGKLPITEDNFIVKCNSLHGNKYDYSNLNYISFKDYVYITCPTHGKFKQLANKHYYGSGCLKCSGNISKSETEWLDYMNVPNSHENRNLYLRFDGKKYNVDGLVGDTVYEFYGDYWHGNPRKYNPLDLNKRSKTTFGDLYYQTILRKEEIIAQGYKFFYIWESDWKKYKKWISL